jgi:starch synthase
MLRRVMHLGPDFEVLDPGRSGELELVGSLPSAKFVNRALWALWRRLPRTGSSHLPMVASCWMADRWASKYVLSGGIFHGLTAINVASLERAKRMGAITVLESPMVHLQHWQEQVLEECQRFGVKPRDCGAVLPVPMIHRALRQYELSDIIVVLSSAAHRSFGRLGLAQKVNVVLPGVDHHFYKPSEELRLPALFRTCYVGRIELAKGLGYLLTAWKKLALPSAELLLVGEIRPEMHSLLQSFACSNVRLTGWLPPHEVAKCYQQSNLLVFPSANEGFGLVLLEAMASGLPVAGTNQSGAPDCVTEGKDGFVIPPRDAEALAGVILWCFQHPEETSAMGRAARAKVERQFTVSHYEERQITFYQSQLRSA